MALVHIHQFAAGVLHSCRRCVDSHKHSDVEVDAEGQHGHNVALIPVGVTLQNHKALVVSSALCDTCFMHALLSACVEWSAPRMGIEYIGTQYGNPDKLRKSTFGKSVLYGSTAAPQQLYRCAM